MVSALILSDRGGGATTFLGLFYASLIRGGVREDGALRVHAPHATLRAFKEVYAALLAGSFPTGRVERGSEDLDFVLGYSRYGGSRLLPARAPRELEVRTADLEELAQMRGRAVVGDAWLRRRLSSRIAIVIVDAGRLPVDPAELEARPHHAFRRFDAEVAGALALLQTYHRTDGPLRRARLHPLFVLTKLDLLPPGLRADGGVGAFPSPADLRGRRRWGERALAPRMPRTWGLISGSGPGIRFDEPAFFASWLGLEGTGSMGPRIRRRRVLPDGGWEPEHPGAEYDALLGTLRALARHEGSAPT